MPVLRAGDTTGPEAFRSKLGESDCIAPDCEKAALALSLSAAAQLNHCFQVKGLGKEVGQGDGLDLVAGSEERAQVAG